jgi:hypothetical protein
MKSREDYEMDLSTAMAKPSMSLDTSSSSSYMQGSSTPGVPATSPSEAGSGRAKRSLV